MDPNEMNWFDRLMWTDRRTDERVGYPPLVVYYWEGSKSEPHQVRDASSSGLFLLTKDRWYLGTVVTMTIQRTRTSDSDPMRSITLNARVVRAVEEGVGLAFEVPMEARKVDDEASSIEVTMKAVTTFLNHAKSDLGQALIEYLLLLPMVLVLILNVVNMGAFFFAWITVANTAHAAANYAALAGASAGGVQPASAAKLTALVTAASASLPNNPSITANICRNFNGAITTVSGTCTSIPADSEPTQYVLTSVDVNYTYTPLIPAGFQFSNLKVYVTIPPSTIHQRAVMRTLQ